MRIRLAGLGGALVLVATLLTGTAAPAGSAESVPGLRDRATVVRDRFGVNHVIARNDHDLFFLQGWVHARDRLFQMDLSRRQASGRRAELLGTDVLADDIQIRTVGIRRAAERGLDVLSDEARDTLAAYTDGVNAWVTTNPLPAEYAEVEVTRFEPWTVLDSVAVGKLIAFGLSFDVDIFPTFDLEAYRAAGAANGFDGDTLWFEDVNRSQPFDSASTVPDATAAAGATGAGRAPAGVGDPAVEAARRWSEEVADLPTFRQLLGPDRFEGSNEWGVAGALTPTGRPIIANDPHLALDLPSTFYPIGLQSPGMRVVGSGFAGAPTVILGHNEHISWGATTNPLDVTDAYREQVVDDPASPSGLSTVYRGQREPVVEIPEEFRVNQPANGTADDAAVVPPGTPVEDSDLGPVPESTLVVPRRNNGPLVLNAFSLQYTGFSGTRELDTFLLWDKAKGLEDFREGLQYFDVGSQNWAYADRKGNLGYFTSAEMPLREDLEAGAVDGLPPWFLRDGTGGNEWLPDDDPAPGQAIPYQILPPEEMPQVLNPAAGFFVNANNDPAGTTLDNDPLNGRRPGGGIYYLNDGYDGFRAGRVTDRLEEEIGRDGSVSFADMASIQSDTELIDAQFFVPYLLDAFDRASASADPALAALAADDGVAEAIGRLAGWDFSTPTGVPEGYDAVEVDGRLSTPSPGEVRNSVAATIYSVWRGQVLQDTVDSTLEALALPTPGNAQALTALRTLLERFGERGGKGASGLDFFAGAGAVSDPADRRDLVLLRSLSGALGLLAGDDFAAAFGGSGDQDDYRWGRLHRIVLDHPLGGERNAPPAGGYATQPGLEGIATDGGFGTVDASGHSARADADDEFMFGSGPVRRYVGEAGSDVIKAESSLPGGASGDVASPHYVDRLGEWLTNDTFRQELSPGRFRRGAVEVLDLRP